MAFKWLVSWAGIVSEVAVTLVSNTEAIWALEAQVRWAGNWLAFSCIRSASTILASDRALWADIEGSAGVNRSGTSHVRASHWSGGVASLESLAEHSVLDASTVTAEDWRALRADSWSWAVSWVASASVIVALVWSISRASDWSATA